MRTIRKIILHCSATFPGQVVRVADITRWHQKRDWKTCGYHYVIDLDGTIEEGRPIEQEGAHYELIKGDTVYLHDTVTQKYFSVVNKVDTIYLDKEVVITHPPEKYVPGFYKWCAGILISLVVGMVLYVVLRIIIKIYLKK